MGVAGVERRDARREIRREARTDRFNEGISIAQYPPLWVGLLSTIAFGILALIAYSEQTRITWLADGISFALCGWFTIFIIVEGIVLVAWGVALFYAHYTLRSVANEQRRMARAIGNDSVVTPATGYQVRKEIVALVIHLALYVIFIIASAIWLNNNGFLGGGNNSCFSRIAGIGSLETSVDGVSWNNLMFIIAFSGLIALLSYIRSVHAIRHPRGMAAKSEVSASSTEFGASATRVQALHG